MNNTIEEYLVATMLCLNDLFNELGVPEEKRPEIKQKFAQGIGTTLGKMALIRIEHEVKLEAEKIKKHDSAT